MLPNETSTSGRLSSSEAGVRAQSEGTLGNSQKPLISLQIPTLQFGTTVGPSSPLKNGQSMQRSHWTGDGKLTADCAVADCHAACRGLYGRGAGAGKGLYTHIILGVDSCAQDIERLAEEKPLAVQQCAAVFRMYDSNNDGMLDMQELSHVLEVPHLHV